MLLDYSARHALPTWRAMGVCFQGVLAIKRGDIAGGLTILRTGFDEGGEGLYEMNHLMFLAEMAEGLARIGQVADAIATIERGREPADRHEDRLQISELLRIKCEILLMQDSVGAAAAVKDLFRQALDWARCQGALSWELRAATSLGRLLRDQGRCADALELLEPVSAALAKDSTQPTFRRQKHFSTRSQNQTAREFVAPDPMPPPAMSSDSDPPPGLTFGRFRVLPHRRELLADGQPVKARGGKLR